jgi:hypothetical protein
MDLTTYVDGLHDELLVAAEAGGDEARALAERLVAPLESAARLALLEALSAAADEITRDLAPGSVEVRLRGRDPEFAVTPPPPEPSFDGPPPSGPAVDEPVVAPDEDGGTVRITLRLPTHLKPGIDEAADRAGLSANAWLVRVVSAALRPGERGRPTDGRPGASFGHRYTGWVR